MDVETLTGEIEHNVLRLEDENGGGIQTFAFTEFGEIFFRTASGEHFKLTVEAIEPAACDFIDEGDWF